ncbi:hypothetical protein NC652_039196 [Populus alba x Populus x berolinensis]|nr:hypothetical protein NC652_039196 [Populus alba x Populus x berolinensis]
MRSTLDETASLFIVDDDIAKKTSDDTVIYKLVQHGDTLLTICSRFKANTAILNRLDNPGRIRYFVYPKTSKEMEFQRI